MATAHPRSIEALLDEQIVAMRAVLDGLAAERHALRKRDIESLNAASERKARCLADAAGLEQERRTLMGEFDNGRFRTDERVRDRWNKLMVLTAEARQQNEANGVMIRWQRRRVEDTLRLLRGTEKTTVTYGPDGENSGGRRPRPPLAMA